MKASESLQNNQSTATENALRRAVDTTPAFIHTARPDGYLDYFNRGWLDFLGKSLEDVCGWRWTESVHPEDVAALVQKWHAALASGEPFEIEARVRRADGSYRALLHRNRSIKSDIDALTNDYFSDAASLAHCQNFSAAGLSRPFATMMPTEIGFGSGATFAYQIHLIFFKSFSTALNSRSPVTNSAFLILAKAAAKQSA